MFARLGRFTYWRRREIIVAWVVILVVGLGLSGFAQSRLDPAVSSGSQRLEAQRAADRIEELTDDGEKIYAIVAGVHVDLETGASLDAETTKVLAAISVAAAELTDKEKSPGVADLVNYADEKGFIQRALRNKSGDKVLISIELEDALSREEKDDALTLIDETLHEIPADHVYVGGPAFLEREFVEVAEKDLIKGEKVALPITLVALGLILGGILVAAMPIGVAISSIAAGFLFVLFLSFVMNVSVFAGNVISMFGLGLGIDYGLLIVSRFREEKALGFDTEQCVERTVATAGMTVAFSALTLAVGLSGLLAFREAQFVSMSIAGMGIAIMAMASALTLLPAMLAMASPKIKPARTDALSHHGYFYRISRIVQRQPVLIVIVVTIILAGLALPFRDVKFEAADYRSLPRSSETRQVAEIGGSEFTFHLPEFISLVAEVPDTDPRIAPLIEEIKAMKGVKSAELDTEQQFRDKASIIEITPDGPPQSEAAIRIIEKLHKMSGVALATSIPGSSATVEPLDFEVTSSGAFSVDLKQVVKNGLPWSLALMAFATFVLLFLMTGSIAVPIKAILMNILSLGATFGALVTVFQNGHFSNALGFDPVGSLTIAIPILVFVFSFALSMDYEVFLISRIKEEYVRTGDNDLAVSIGLQRTGKIISSAALLMVIVFSGFASGELVSVKQLGLGMALAVVVDATIVRSFLVPATMKLLGDWNWWAPAPMLAIYERFGIEESHELAMEAYSPYPSTDPFGEGLPAVAFAQAPGLVQAPSTAGPTFGYQAPAPAFAGNGYGAPTWVGAGISSEHKAELVLRLLRGETLQGVSAETHVPPTDLVEWREKFLHGAVASLAGMVATVPGETAPAHFNESTGGLPGQIDAAAAKRIGELEEENEFLRAAAHRMWLSTQPLHRE